MRSLPEFEAAMTGELSKKKYDKGFIRIHDGGDFLSQVYAESWLAIARLFPNINFYAYTKEVQLFKETLLVVTPSNFTLIYSYGGRQDHMIDREVDRNSDVFPTIEALEAAGYVDIEEDDKLAATHPNPKIGLVVNNISHLKRKQGDLTFSSWQEGNRPPKVEDPKKKKKVVA